MKINKDEWANLSVEGFMKKLSDTHRSVGYLVIRDCMTKELMDGIRANKDVYKEFQAIKQECKESWDYDHKTPNMLDLNKGLTNLYGVILRLISAMQNSHTQELDEIRVAINKIEEKIGIEPTDWNGGKELGADNVQGITACDERTE